MRLTKGTTEHCCICAVIIHPLFYRMMECAVPQEHLAGSTVGVLIKRVHLEVMLIGCGSLWLDVGPGLKGLQE